MKRTWDDRQSDCETAGVPPAANPTAPALPPDEATLHALRAARDSCLANPEIGCILSLTDRFCCAADSARASAVPRASVAAALMAVAESTGEPRRAPARGPAGVARCHVQAVARLEAALALGVDDPCRGGVATAVAAILGDASFVVDTLRRPGAFAEYADAIAARYRHALPRTVSAVMTCLELGDEDRVAEVLAETAVEQATPTKTEAGEEQRRRLEQAARQAQATPVTPLGIRKQRSKSIGHFSAALLNPAAHFRHIVVAPRRTGTPGTPMTPARNAAAFGLRRSSSLGDTPSMATPTKAASRVKY
eukprot:m51a1_g12258 hypothetical protein (307) ;mRNA; f:175868-176924